MKKRVLFLVMCVFLSASGACKQSGEGNEVSKPDVEENKGSLSKAVTENLISELQGAVLKNLMVVGKDGPYYCNIGENVTAVYSFDPADFPVLVCKDPVYDITYYVNYGRDYYIYAKRGDTSECVVEIPARDLYCREGVLYFRADDFNLYEFESFADGAILTYNPTDGGVEVVINEPTFEMAVYPDGILYAILELYTEADGTMWGTRQDFYYSFEDRKSKMFEGMSHTISRWKEYQLVAETSVGEEGAKKVGYRLETPDGESGGMLPNWSELPAVYRVREDGIFYLDVKENALIHYDIQTGEYETLVEAALPSTFPTVFFVQDDVVYLSNGIRYSFSENKQYKVEIKEKGSAWIQGYYTDGEELYVLADGMLWLYEEKRVEETGYVTSQIPGRPFTIGCYEAELHPLGE